MDGIKAPKADATVVIPDHASQILQAQAGSITEKRNRIDGTKHKTPELKTDQEAKDYISRWSDHYAKQAKSE